MTKAAAAAAAEEKRGEGLSKELPGNRGQKGVPFLRAQRNLLTLARSVARVPAGTK